MVALKILSLCDYSGRWPLFFKASGYEVEQIDIKLGTNIFDYKPSGNIVGVLFAPPCTDFSVSGAQYWGQKDSDGRTKVSVMLVERGLSLIKDIDPEFWILENPVGRLKNWIGPPKTYIHPYEFAGYSPKPSEDAYTKKTGLWGTFLLPPKRPVLPIVVCKQGSWVQKLGGKSERTKELRSMTPLGLANATYIANDIRTTSRIAA